MSVTENRLKRDLCWVDFSFESYLCLWEGVGFYGRGLHRWGRVWGVTGTQLVRYVGGLPTGRGKSWQHPQPPWSAWPGPSVTWYPIWCHESSFCLRFRPSFWCWSSWSLSWVPALVMPHHYLLLFNSFTKENGLMGPCSLYLPWLVILSVAWVQNKRKTVHCLLQAHLLPPSPSMSVYCCRLTPYKHKELSHLRNMLFPLPGTLFPQSSHSHSSPSGLKLHTTSSKRHSWPLFWSRPTEAPSIGFNLCPLWYILKFHDYILFCLSKDYYVALPLASKLYEERDHVHFVQHFASQCTHGL